jgi:hypothetical protein
MACDGNCAKCPVQCGAAKILEKIKADPEKETEKLQTKKEQEKMSNTKNMVKAAGCGAPSDPEDIRQNAAIIAISQELEGMRNFGGSTPLSTGIKSSLHQAQCMAVIGILGAMAAAFMSWTALRDLQRMCADNAALREEIRRVEEKADAAKEKAMRSIECIRENHRN